ncbi:MAG: phosphate ABC transporter permease PstA [Chthoniobacterales bacterium]
MENIVDRETDFFADQAISSGTAGRSFGNRLLTTLCIGLSFLTLIPLFSIVYMLLVKGLPLLSWEVFTELPPAAGLTGGGFGNAIVGTFVMVAIALAIATPLGMLSAIYVTEYAPYSRLSRIVRFVAKLLTGIPSIIAGVFAYAIIVLYGFSIFGVEIIPRGFSAFAGGVALAVLILPTILLTSEQALLGVQRAYREASFGLGATPFQTIWRIVLPEALPAMMTGVMLAVARAAGETAPVLFTALFSAFYAKSILDETASLSVLIYNFATLPYEHQVNLAWTASLVLVALVTATNVFAQLVFRKK